jgi:aspartate aminotransferase-like enzyme
LSSNLVAGLTLALETLNSGVRANEVRETADWLCRQLQEAGIPLLAAAAVRFPGAITIPVPPPVNSGALGKALQHAGWLVSYQSNYLIERNWIQLCLFGHVERADLEPLPRFLAAQIKMATT